MDGRQNPCPCCVVLSLQVPWADLRGFFWERNEMVGDGTDCGIMLGVSRGGVTLGMSGEDVGTSG